MFVMKMQFGEIIGLAQGCVIVLLRDTYIFLSSTVDKCKAVERGNFDINLKEM